MKRQGREKGFFISFGFTADALREITRALREEGLDIIPVMVHEILDEEVSLKL